MTALIDFAAPTPHCKPLRLAFGSPRHTLMAAVPEQVPEVLNRAHEYAKGGLWCVGYLAFEAGAAFDSAFSVHPSTEPLAWFAVYDQPLPILSAPKNEDWELTPWVAAVDEPQFSSQISSIHQAIACGEVYQVNLTSPLQSHFRGDALALFHALRRAQPNSYAAYLDTDSLRLLSASPELFFDWRDGEILSRPMKGTAARGHTPQADAEQARLLRQSVKEQAENLMIVDLIRNDLSRVAEPFSVQVPKLFETNAWPTIWQMTSDVVAKTKPQTRLADVFSALFPCGSVIGAPKVRAMHWIKQLEAAPRGPYCGAIGVLQPGGAATFNVAIRTIELRGTTATCGIGSGITADATAVAEWQEWKNKRGFLQRTLAPFKLLETLLLKDGHYPLEHAHLARMEEAALHFGFVFDLVQIKQVLSRLANNHESGSWRVRLVSDANGQADAQAHVLADAGDCVRVQLATEPIGQARSEFVRFKTTRREHYDAFAPVDPAVFDTLLWNDDGELTEFTRGNVGVLIDGQWLTPHAHCGLLQGIGRDVALREGCLKEATILREDLARAQGLAFINSVRGWLAAALV